MARQPSDLEAHMARDIRAMKLPAPEVEYQFLKERKWRFDFAWPRTEDGRPVKVALEVEGGTYSGGAHTRGKHFESDCEKYNSAAINGWLVLRVTKHMIEDGRAVDTLLVALIVRGGA